MTKVAILGGGISSLVTAFELTSTPELRAKYDVTVHQMGWRLGGKGASGRNRDVANRIEEHGLHIWMGFYENAFTVMRACYQELGRTPPQPLSTWKDAFHQHSYIVLEEKLDDGFHPWTFDFPTNGLEPGDGGSPPTAFAYAELIVKWMLHLWEGSPKALSSNIAPGSPRPSVASWIEGLVTRAGTRGPGHADPKNDALGHGTVVPGGPAPLPTHEVSTLMSKAYSVLRSLDANPAAHTALEHHGIAALIRAAMDLAWLFLEHDVNTDFEVRKIWVGLNLAGAAVVGILEDGIIFRGWDTIDQFDLREWLESNGANDVTLDSGPLRGVYDLVFGYIDGSVKNGAFAAGTAMRGMLRMVLAYKGSIFYRMQAGMGDVVATPLYSVLKKRGVHFRFFERVTDLRLSADSNLVQQIAVRTQVKLVDPRGEYQPLFPVNDLDCWPSAPLYEQIADGQALKDSQIDFESAWADRWKDEKDIVLELGRDFDQVVLGISIGALPYMASALLKASPALGQSVEQVKTVQTQALQLWLLPTLAQLGWQTPAGIAEAPVLGAYVEPIDTWADMSDLLPRETWPADHLPQSIAYFCGPFEQSAPLPPFSDHGFPERERQRYAAMARDFLDVSAKGLWPAAATTAGFRFDLLVDLQDRPPGARLEHQWLRVNVDPTERYVLSVPGSTKYRLRADASGFANVVLAGDWTSNGINAGCIEAAVMSGMLASRALCGLPSTVVAEVDALP